MVVIGLMRVIGSPILWSFNKITLELYQKWALAQPIPNYFFITDTGNTFIFECRYTDFEFPVCNTLGFAKAALFVRRPIFGL